MDIRDAVPSGWPSIFPIFAAVDAHGQEVGRAPGIQMVDWATSRGYRSIQFNVVVESNEPAVLLWRPLGFDVIGTVPGAFEHPELGFVGLKIRVRSLTNGEPTGPHSVAAEQQ